jgi:hypothetical protein
MTVRPTKRFFSEISESSKVVFIANLQYIACSLNRLIAEPRILESMHMVATNSRRMQRVLLISLAATLCYVVATFYFGLRAHSLALISEAGHNLSDMLAIGLSFVAVYFQRRPATDQKTFGYQRAGVLAAFVNALTLIVLAAWIALSAIHRLYAPVAVQPRIMMAVAAAGVLMNGAIAAPALEVFRRRQHPHPSSCTCSATPSPPPPSSPAAQESSPPGHPGSTRPSHSSSPV